jgi:beta-galactosidase
VVYLQNFLTFTSEWTVAADGSVRFKFNGEFDDKQPYLPRLGLKLALPKNHRSVAYFGYGPNESYCDKHRSSYIDSFVTTLSELHEDYIKPQENGSRYYTIKELYHKKHNFKLEEADYVTLCIDYKNSGIGSNSYGPELKPEYRLADRKISWEIGLFFE